MCLSMTGSKNLMWNGIFSPYQLPHSRQSIIILIKVSALNKKLQFVIKGSQEEFKGAKVLCICAGSQETLNVIN